MKKRGVSSEMVFNFFTFVVFFAVILLFHRLPVGWTKKKIQLLLASYLTLPKTLLSFFCCGFPK
jgi:hypothetical protein